MQQGLYAYKQQRKLNGAACIRTNIYCYTLHNVFGRRWINVDCSHSASGQHFIEKTSLITFKILIQGITIRTL